MADFYRENDRQALEANAPSTNEEWLTFADGGHSGLFETIKAPMCDSDGNAVGVMGISRDITARKRTEQALYETAMKLQEAVRATNIGLWDWDLATSKVHYSAEWKRQIGYDEQEISDDFAEWEHRVHPDDLTSALEQVRQAIADKNQQYRLEFRFRHKNGAYRWMLAQGSVLSDESGKVVRVLGSHIDITERKRAEEALRELKEFNEYIVQTMNEGIALTDSKGIVTFINPELATLLGYAPKELIGRSWLDVVPPDQQAIGRAADERRKTGQADRYEIELQGREGERLPVLIGGTPRIDARTGEFADTLGVLTDITERKQAEVERGKLQDQLTQARRQTIAPKPLDLNETVENMLIDTASK